MDIRDHNKEVVIEEELRSLPINDLTNRLLQHWVEGKECLPFIDDYEKFRQAFINDCLELEPLYSKQIEKVWNAIDKYIDECCHRLGAYKSTKE